MELSDDYVDPGDPPTTVSYLYRCGFKFHKVQVLSGPRWWSAVRTHRVITVRTKDLVR